MPPLRGFGFLLVSILQRFRTYGAETRNSRPLDAVESLFQKLNEPRGIRHGQVRRDGVTIFRDGLGFHDLLLCAGDFEVMIGNLKAGFRYEK
jgi:hypothetical protein